MKLDLQDLFQTTITSIIPATTSDGSFTITTAPNGSWGYIEIDSEDIAKKEKFKYYNVSGNTVFYRGVDRPTPKEHQSGASVVIKDFSFFFNHLNELVGEQFKLEKKGLLSLLVWGGVIRNADGTLTTLSDTSLTLTASQTNYIYIDTVDNTIKFSITLDTALNGWIIGEVDTDATKITIITSYTPKYVGGYNKVFDTTTTLKKYNTKSFCTNSSGAVTYTLPLATVGLSFDFRVGSNNNLTIQISGTNIVDYEGTTGSAGGTVINNTTGETLALKCFETGIWAVTGIEGNWTLS